MGKIIPRYRIELVKESSKVYDVGGFQTSSDIKTYLDAVFNLSNQAEEVFVMMVLDIKNRVIGAFEVSRGTINASIVHPREVYKRALLLNGATIAVAHNHPSGNLEPSKADIEMTDRLKKAGDVLGIPLLDHLIVGPEGGYESLIRYI